MPKKSTKKKPKPRRSEKGIERKRPGQEVLRDEFAEEFNREFDSKENDSIFGLYGAPEHNLGVVKVLYSGLPRLDQCLAIKRDTNIHGLPMNKILELFGKEQSGKTTLALYCIVQIIKHGGLAYFVDFEHKFDPAWLRRIAKMNQVTEDMLHMRFRYIDPKHMEGFIKWLLQFMKRVIQVKMAARKKILEIETKKNKPDNVEELIAQQQAILDKPFIVVVDSLAGIYTRAEKEAKDGKVAEEELTTKVAEIPNIFSRCLKNIRHYLGFTNALILFLNQIRDNIETNQYLARYASKIKTPCGNAVKHFSDGRLQISRTASVYRTRNSIKYMVGSDHVVRVVKNQMGPPPFQEAQIRLLHDRGFFSFLNVLDAMVGIGKVKLQGSKYTFVAGDKEIVVDRTAADEFADKNPKIVSLLHAYYQKYMEKN